MEFEIVEKSKLVYQFNIESGRPEYEIDNTKDVKYGSFHRVGYYLQLQHPLYGNQYIFTTFDTFTKNPIELGIPKQNNKVFLREIHNLSITDSNGKEEKEKTGFLKFTGYNYFTGETKGEYGCMQIHCENEVLWAYNNHNGNSADVGIGNYTGSGHADWTFTSNACEYSFKQMKIYVIYNDVVFPEQQIYNNIRLGNGVDKDKIEYNIEKKLWECAKKEIKFKDHSDVFLPNFIIGVIGQGNSQGKYTKSNISSYYDKQHERIFGYNQKTDSWEVADMNTESLGNFENREKGSHLSVFHMAKRLCEANGTIRPGIVNIGSEKNIHDFVRFEKTDEFYNENIKNCVLNGGKIQGTSYDKHCLAITKSLSHLKDFSKSKVDVICVLVGDYEEDYVNNEKYFSECLKKIIEQYRQESFVSENIPIFVCNFSQCVYQIQDKFNRVIHCNKYVTTTEYKKFVDVREQMKIGNKLFKELIKM